MEFLLKAFDVPPVTAIESAMETLFEVGAIEKETQAITTLGLHLSQLPVDVHLGKMILYSCLFSCVEPVLTIAASMSNKSPFMVTVGRSHELR